ncbi:MAG: thymidine phosphorylase [Anaerolineae bacterium]|nr:thymidine phosphorylase [Anaerolineae bacterium]
MIVIYHFQSPYRFIGYKGSFILLLVYQISLNSTLNFNGGVLFLNHPHSSIDYNGIPSFIEYKVTFLLKGCKEDLMRAVDIIIKKRDHQELTKEEIEFLIKGLVDNTIPDYQAAAWAMAVLLNGMTDRETTDLTLAMANSGDILDLSPVVPFTVDKHSTGGVGDKTSLTVAPIVAACGLPVGKMSGRGLGFSGGTLDKIQSIPGYRTDLSPEEFMEQLDKIGIVLTGQSANLAPADGILYALRDVTGTVQSLPLIASSIMSKKLAAGADAIVLDVKSGNGAFMQTLEDARALATIMTSIGNLSGRKVVCLLSDMNQPLGQEVGNALELKEAVEALHGNAPEDFMEHCLVVSSHMLVLGNKASNLEEARKLAQHALDSGNAYQKLLDLVEAQKGDVAYVKDLSLLPTAKYIETVPAPDSGYLKMIHAREVGETAVDLGAGRASKKDQIDPAVGITILHKVGDHVNKGEPLFIVHANDENKLANAKHRLLNAHQIIDTPCEPLPLFYGVIE